LERRRHVLVGDVAEKRLPAARRAPSGAPKADSDVDSNGRALSDEFSDCVSAYVAGKFDSTISVESVAKIVE
jgi:hypothetical protein